MKINYFYLITFFVGLFFLSDVSMAKDFSASIRTLKTEVSDILMVAGPLALMVAGGAFYFSNRVGSSLLLSSGIGVIIFAASGTIFQWLYRVFN